jgi:hypothetical protein
MAVISICIENSREEIVNGIPLSISLSTNISATIFYTIDGSLPTLFSPIYTSPIFPSTEITSLTLSVFATNGVDTSTIIVERYQTNLLGQDARFPHSGTNACPNSEQATIDPTPFGSPPIQPNQQFLGPGAAGLNVFNPEKPAGKPTGYNAEGEPTGFTNNQQRALPTPGFPYTYSDSDQEGVQGYGIGTLPLTSIVPPKPVPEQSEYGSQFFDPRAFVIIDDLTQPRDPGLPPLIHRSAFTLENVERTREGGIMFNTALDGLPTTGSFVSRQFNSSKNTMTYYYMDSIAQRWIISTVPYYPAADQFNYAQATKFGVSGRPGSQYVYQWVMFKGSWLNSG